MTDDAVVLGLVLTLTTAVLLWVAVLYVALWATQPLTAAVLTGCIAVFIAVFTTVWAAFAWWLS